MSVIQQIQEKYAKLMAIIIAVALLTFVVMLAFENGGSLFRGSAGTVVGSVNGQEIGLNDFGKKIDQQEEGLKQQGYTGTAARQQAIELAWRGEVNRLLMASEINELGMQIGKKELGDILYGPNPPQYLRQLFSDPKTGIYDARLAKSKIDETMRKAKPEQKAELNAYMNDLEFVRMNEKYNSLLSNSINYPKWYIQKQNDDNSQLSKISFVREVYTSIPDSTITISDKEVEDYVNEHKDQFKQDENRSIAYVAFSALPTAKDSAATLTDITKLKPEFDSTKEIENFLTRAGSTIKFRLTKNNSCGNQYYDFYFSPTYYSYSQYSLYTISPNPATSTLSVAVDEEKLSQDKIIKSNSQDIKEISILDKMGTLIRKQGFGNNIRKANLNISNLKTGVYILKIFNGKDFTSLKFIKE